MWPGLTIPGNVARSGDRGQMREEAGEEEAGLDNRSKDNQGSVSSKGLPHSTLRFEETGHVGFGIKSGEGVWKLKTQVNDESNSAERISPLREI